MLRAEMNANYWSRLSRRYYNWERAMKFFLLAMSSSTVAGWSVWANSPLIWKGFSVVAALSAIALPVLNWTKHIADCSDLFGRWTQIASELGKLWSQIEGKETSDAEIEKAFDRIQEKALEATKPEAQLPIDKRLLQIA
jgi:hypothetical protein